MRVSTPVFVSIAGISILLLISHGLVSATESTQAAQKSSATKADERGLRMHLNRIGADELEFIDREEPQAIPLVAKAMRLSDEEIEAILNSASAYRLSLRSIWAKEPQTDAEARVKGKEVARAHSDLVRRGVRLLGNRYYDFSKLLSREMNRRRFLKEGKVLPPRAKDISTQ